MLIHMIFAFKIRVTKITFIIQGIDYFSSLFKSFVHNFNMLIYMIFAFEIRVTKITFMIQGKDYFSPSCRILICHSIIYVHFKNLVTRIH